MIRKYKITISKQQLLSDYNLFKQWLLDYWKFLEDLPLSSFTDDKQIVDFLKDQHHALIKTKVRMEIVDMISALIQLTLGRLTKDELTFEIPERKTESAEAYQFITDLSSQIKNIESSLLRLVEQVSYLTRHLPASEDQQKLVHILQVIGSLFKAIIRQDQDDIRIELNQLNVLTSSQESYLLLEEIGKVTREIYNSLQELSHNIDPSEIQHATDEMPDAVQKLYSVIKRLEDATNDNLDFLEKLLQQCEENIELAREMSESCEVLYKKLDAVHTKHPQTSKEMGELKLMIKEKLHCKIEALLGVLHEDENSYIAIMSNQGFQDLTGQTLKKIIDFMEKLELRLLKLIQTYTSRMGEQDSNDKDSILTRIDIGSENEKIKLHGPDESETQKSSQNDVDSLLAELGF
ncbi:MAG: protein phosphatase CheZ [SAR324 cluster bacterium]|nr:protein phosphatase CheZ [SAR324 cluster bacterium]